VSEKPFPTELRRVAANEIEIAWSDGATLRYRAQLLRDACPCATCREHRGEGGMEKLSGPPQSLGLPVLSAAEARPLTIDNLRPVGNYAYNIAFSDGHRSGLFTLELLRRIGQPVEA
jgi:DUF971 family protein